jgi:hypothetical protein
MWKNLSPQITTMTQIRALNTFTTEYTENTEKNFFTSNSFGGFLHVTVENRIRFIRSILFSPVPWPLALDTPTPRPPSP